MEIIATYLIIYTTTDDLAGKGPLYSRVYVVCSLNGLHTGPDETLATWGSIAVVVLIMGFSLNASITNVYLSSKQD